MASPLRKRVLRRLALAVPRRAKGDLTGMWLMPAARGYHTGDYERQLVEALRRVVEPGFVCVDVGAHLGYVTMVLARLAAPGGHVFAYEASRANVRTIARHRRLNRLGDIVTVVPKAVTDGRAATVQLFPRSGTSSEWSVFRDFAEREGRPSRGSASVVDATSLDHDFATQAVNVVKIDVEGAEGLVIAGMSEIIRRDRPTIVLEFHRPVGWKAIELLTAAGYGFETLQGARLPTFKDADDVPYQLVAAP